VNPQREEEGTIGILSVERGAVLLTGSGKDGVQGRKKMVSNS